jgi:L-seryl-tRNA(Ser) seleniumtransferase
MAQDPKDLPQIQSLLTQPLIIEVSQRYSHSETVDALRHVVAKLRAGILSNTQRDLPDFASPAFAATIATEIEAGRAPSLVPVINATGIIIHTNLGRARLAPQAILEMQSIAAAPSNLELNLKTGKRGSRHAHVEQLI